MTTKISIFAMILLTFAACNRNENLADAYGNFEVDETVVSSLMAGELVQFEIEEGSTYQEGQVVGYTDTTD